jgi:transposase
MEGKAPKYSTPVDYFSDTDIIARRQYEALRCYFVEKKSAAKVANQYNYSIHAFYSLIKEFKQKLSQDEEPFFKTTKRGRRQREDGNKLKNLIITLRKQYLSAPDIKAILDTKNYSVSVRHVSDILRQEGFARMPRRDAEMISLAKKEAQTKVSAPQAVVLDLATESFLTQQGGLLCFMPLLVRYGIYQAMVESAYPGTKVVPKEQSILSFLALKLSNIRRYSADDIWCMDRGMGLFAGLNVLPKTAWFSSYSYRITQDMNLAFLKQLHQLWIKHDLLSDTINMDFTTIPYWGNDAHLENNWSGKRNQALSSMLAVLAQDPDSGIIDYGNTNVMHKNQNDVVLEFIDFYQEGQLKISSLQYLVFDSKFAPYANLSKIDDHGIKFVTIRRRGKKIVDAVNAVPENKRRKIHIMMSNNKGRTLRVLDETTSIHGYDKPIRQVAITGHGRIKPALIITNDFDISLEKLVRKYTRRWIVEKGISEQIEFFHLNRVSSSIVIKVDFDLVMTILAHNLYRLLAKNIERYANATSQTLYEKLVINNANIVIDDNKILVKLQKKRHVPLLLDSLNIETEIKKIPWLKNYGIKFTSDAST